MWKTRSDRSYRVVSLLTAFGFMGSLIISPVVYSASPEGKGKGNANANSGNKGQGNQQGAQARGGGKALGQDKAASVNRGSAAAKADRQHPHQQRANRSQADKATGVGQGAENRIQVAQLPQAARGHAFGVDLGGRDAANINAANLSRALNKLEHARWSHNPHDERGQGNMGKVDMQDPYGFARDDRKEETGNRGRPIRVSETKPEEPVVEEPVVEEPVLDPILEDGFSVSVDFSSLEAIDEFYWTWYLNIVASYDADIYGSWYTYEEYKAAWYDHFFKYSDTSSGLIISHELDPMNYSLTLDGEGTYEITTELVSLESVTRNKYTWDPETGNWTIEPYEVLAGDVIFQESTEVVFDADNSTYDYSTILERDLTAGNLNTELQVTVTDTSTGESTTTTYDKALYLFRCPYGIVYDTKSGEPIVGATVTVHNADGSVVLLDKAANPNVSNPQTTDATGRYNCKLAVGKKYYLTIKAPGYEEYQSKLFSERWHIVREDVGLTRSTMISKK